MPPQLLTMGGDQPLQSTAPAQGPVQAGNVEVLSPEPANMLPSFQQAIAAQPQREQSPWPKLLSLAGFLATGNPSALLGLMEQKRKRQLAGAIYPYQLESARLAQSGKIDEAINTMYSAIGQFGPRDVEINAFLNQNLQRLLGKRQQLIDMRSFYEQQKGIVDYFKATKGETHPNQPLVAAFGKLLKQGTPLSTEYAQQMMRQFSIETQQLEGKTVLTNPYTAIQTVIPQAIVERLADYDPVALNMVANDPDVIAMFDHLPTPAEVLTLANRREALPQEQQEKLYTALAKARQFTARAETARRIPLTPETVLAARKAGYDNNAIYTQSFGKNATEIKNFAQQVVNARTSLAEAGMVGTLAAARKAPIEQMIPGTYGFDIDVGQRIPGATYNSITADPNKVMLDKDQQIKFHQLKELQRRMALYLEAFQAERVPQEPDINNFMDRVVKRLTQDINTKLLFDRKTTNLQTLQSILGDSLETLLNSTDIKSSRFEFMRRALASKDATQQTFIDMYNNLADVAEGQLDQLIRQGNTIGSERYFKRLEVLEKEAGTAGAGTTDAEAWKDFKLR